MVYPEFYPVLSGIKDWLAGAGWAMGLGLCWLGLFVLACAGLGWLGLACAGWAGSGLPWAWLGLGWLGWFGLAWAYYSRYGNRKMV